MCFSRSVISCNDYHPKKNCFLEGRGALWEQGRSRTEEQEHTAGPGQEEEQTRAQKRKLEFPERRHISTLRNKPQVARETHKARLSFNGNPFLLSRTREHAETPKEPFSFSWSHQPRRGVVAEATHRFWWLPPATPDYFFLSSFLKSQASYHSNYM